MRRTSTAINRDFHGALSALRVENLGDAERWCDAVMRVNRKHAGAPNVMAVVLTQLGRFADRRGFNIIHLSVGRSPIMELCSRC
jgi:Flp pilus assembly protein TadD